MNKKLILFALIGYGSLAISMEVETPATRALRNNTRATEQLATEVRAHQQRHSTLDERIATLETQLNQLHDQLEPTDSDQIDAADHESPDILLQNINHVQMQLKDIRIEQLEMQLAQLQVKRQATKPSTALKILLRAVGTTTPIVIGCCWFGFKLWEQYNPETNPCHITNYSIFG